MIFTAQTLWKLIKNDKYFAEKSCSMLKDCILLVPKKSGQVLLITYSATKYLVNNWQKIDEQLSV